MLTDHRIALLGAGNLASCLIKGLLANGVSPKAIRASQPDAEKRAHLSALFPIQFTSTNLEAVQEADAIIICVKPGVVASVMDELTNFFAESNPKPFLISVATGISIHTLEKQANTRLPIVRAMPNTPAIVGAAMTGMFANSLVNEEQHSLVESIFRAVGSVMWLDHEAQLDAITAISGSGPAYFFYFMECLREAASTLGLPEKMTEALVTQTALGSARLAIESGETLETLRRQVTSPGGTTAQALAAFEACDLKTTVLKAAEAAYQRAKEIGEQYKS